ncbi:MAG: SRPBCC family protein [Myxococcales bacterium]|nr:SRPBCC family protein [Myxococcales bacterium]
MAFEVTKTLTVKAPATAVWDFLTDPARVAKCLPGAAITGKLDEKTWSGTMTVKVGPVQSSYKGKVVFEKLDAKARSAEIVATGTDTKGKGGADLRLTSSVVEKPDGASEVTTVSRVNVTGILAQMGRGMIEDVGDRMFQIFSENLRSELEATMPSVRPIGEPPPQHEHQPVPPPQQRALDVGSIGARVLVRRPEFWVALAVAAAALYLLVR